MEEKIKVLIAEDVAPIRKRYAAVLKKCPAIEVAVSYTHLDVYKRQVLSLSDVR